MGGMQSPGRNGPNGCCARWWAANGNRGCARMGDMSPDGAVRLLCSVQGGALHRRSGRFGRCGRVGVDGGGRPAASAAHGIDVRRYRPMRARWSRRPGPLRGRSAFLCCAVAAGEAPGAPCARRTLERVRRGAGGLPVTAHALTCSAVAA